MEENSLSAQDAKKSNPNEKDYNEELIVSVYKDTPTIRILDKFEGIGQEDKPYKRIVIRNGFFTGLCDSITNQLIRYHFVIERASREEYVGDITFTEFKHEKTDKLTKYVESCLNDSIIEKYLDTDKYYRFEKPFHLRAQNSSNRSGYGWQWNWSRGYVSYIEGTYYGETTDYVFSGVYISSTFNYDPNKRHPFSLLSNPEINQLDSDSIPSNSNLISVSVYGHKNGDYKVIPYSGKLENSTRKHSEMIYIPLVRGNSKVMIPASLVEEEKSIYINNETYKAYKHQIRDRSRLEIKHNFID